MASDDHSDDSAVDDAAAGRKAEPMGTHPFRTHLVRVGILSCVLPTVVLSLLVLAYRQPGSLPAAALVTVFVCLLWIIVAGWIIIERLNREVLSVLDYSRAAHSASGARPAWTTCTELNDFIRFSESIRRRLDDSEAELRSAIEQQRAERDEVVATEQTAAEETAATDAAITELADEEAEDAWGDEIVAADTVAGQLAHDLNNMITPLATYLHILKKHLPTGSYVEENLHVMESNVENVANLARQIVMLSRAGKHARKLVDPVEAVNNVLALLRSTMLSREIELVTSFEDDLAPTWGCGEDLMRVFHNLCQNGIEAMEPGGVLNVTVRTATLDGAGVGRFKSVVPGEYTLVRISDSGQGIAEELRDKIFQAFYTTKSTSQQSGSGLGLSIVAKVVKETNGYIDLESEVGKGTAFSLYLPVASDRERDAVATAAARDEPGERENAPA